MKRGKWPNINVGIDRVDNSNRREARKEIGRLLAILGPSTKDGLRVRVGVAPTT